MRKITIHSLRADPYFQSERSAYSDKVETELKKFPSYGRLFYSEGRGVTWEMIGMRAEGNVVVEGDMSIKFSSSGPVVHGLHTEPNSSASL